jgi:hypothetical protein
MDLAQLMSEETLGLTSPPTLLHDVRHGGRRRQQRRRVLLSVTAVMALLAAGLGVTTLRTPSPVTRYSGPLFDGATHGDLAGDQSYLAAAISAWNHSHDQSGNKSRGIFNDLRGTPHVVWAGTTPGGRAAVVAQDAYLHHHGDIQLKHEGIYQLLGFVGPGADGAPRIVGDTYPDPEGLLETAWYVDPARTVVAAVNDGHTPGISLRWTYAADGTARRDYTPMQDAEGVGLAVVPASSAPSVSRLPFRDIYDLMRIHGSAQRQLSASDRMSWTGMTRLGGATAPAGSVVSVLWRLLAARRHGEAIEVRGGSWSVAADVGGHSIMVGEIGLDQEPTRIYAVVDEKTIIDSGFANEKATLPVRVPLPGGLGTIVARYGAALAYRTAGGPWVSAGQDAALVPPSATQVRVTVPGQPEHTVDLP